METYINSFRANGNTYEDVFEFMEDNLFFNSLKIISTANHSVNEYRKYIELITDKATIEIEKASETANQWFVAIKDHKTGLMYEFGCPNLVFAFKPAYTTLNQHIISA